MIRIGILFVNLYLVVLLVQFWSNWVCLDICVVGLKILLTRTYLLNQSLSLRTLLIIREEGSYRDGFLSWQVKTKHVFNRGKRAIAFHGKRENRLSPPLLFILFGFFCTISLPEVSSFSLFCLGEKCYV